MRPLINDYFVSLQHNMNYVQCCLVLNYMFTFHCVEGLRNVIADTLSRLLRSYMSSPLVGKKAANDISNSESNNRNESSHSSVMNERVIIDCLMNLPCLSFKKKGKGDQQHAEFWNDTRWEQILVVISFLQFHCWTVLFQSPWRYGWRQPFRSGEHQRHKTMMRNTCNLQLSSQSGTVTRLATMLKTSWVTLNQVIIQSTGKLHYLRTW